MEKSLLLHRNSQPRRGGWVAETNSLLNCRIPQGVPGVRIPPSPRRKKTMVASSFFSGYGAVRLAHLLWEQGVEGSNPFAPTNWKRGSYEDWWLPRFLAKIEICPWFAHEIWNIDINLPIVYLYFPPIYRDLEKELPDKITPTLKGFWAICPKFAHESNLYSWFSDSYFNIKCAIFAHISHTNYR